ncbi:hypothetical protein GHNINEIG_00630 [Hydrogenovibrio crunogenus]|uniref:Uncharacterized protein n=1 Tax=Hydrogenovibrio crunogenus TaxID=39765 RepID=A0A4P7NYA1_9GAMM|nr:hypothetical protein [Hydrogenovibrio crunogenus]QBZ82598.1 hypothetical protein GHNINEIG_00630 [Hydrogenovibrio crunogenus]RUM90440.1 MAG: hypothetical protein DSZ27_09395 [Thiomicrospira sp.]
MPYQVTSIQNDKTFTSIVPRGELAYAIIKYLVKLGLTLDSFKELVKTSGLNPAHILSEEEFRVLAEQHPEMSLIYESIQLKNNQRMYFHTNWTVPSTHWQLLNQELQKYQVQVTTLKTPDLPAYIRAQKSAAVD